MYCDYCSRPVPYLGRRHTRRRLVVPRCRLCGRVAFGLPHKLLLLLLFAAALYLIIRLRAG